MIRQGMAQHEFSDPVKRRAQRQSRVPPIPFLGIKVLAIGIIVIRVYVRLIVLIAVITVGNDVVASHPQLAMTPGSSQPYKQRGN